MTFDLLIRDARVVDGTGMPAFSADLAVQGGRIARIGRVREGARRVVERPVPKSTRPPEIKSSTATDSAVRTGWLYGFGSRRTP